MMKYAIVLPLLILISQSHGMPISDDQSTTEGEKDVLNMNSNYAHVRILYYIVYDKIYHFITIRKF